MLILLHEILSGWLWLYFYCKLLKYLRNYIAHFWLISCEVFNPFMMIVITSNITSVLQQNRFPFLLKNWQKCIYYYFSDFARGERCWCADCQWRYAAAGLSPNLMLWMWADVFREIDWNRGKDSVQVRAEFFRENNAVISASFAPWVCRIMSFLFLNFRENFLQFCLSEIRLKYLHKNSLLRHSIHVYFLHHRHMHHRPNSPASPTDP